MSDESLDRLNDAFAGRYQIERELGHGGMATVYLAQDEKHHRRVAIKVLSPGLASLLGAERFLHEIEIVAQLNHPHILPLHDSGRAGGFLYFVMPYVEGEPLSARLEREGELPVTVALRILREIVDALAAAHRHGIVHRDVKPSNVMLSENHALVTDFGIAKAVSQATESRALTTTGIALGTPLYMAPEQVSADPHIDHRADIYSVGVVAYEMLTGHPPFAAPSRQVVLAAHLGVDPVPVTTIREAVPQAVNDAVMRCLAKQPADRWQTADELLKQLEALSSVAVGTMRPGRQRTPLRPGRQLFLVGTTAVAAVAVAVGLWSSHNRRPPTFVFGRSPAVTAEAGLEIHPSLSPDGGFVAYAAGNASHMRIYIRDVHSGRRIPLSNDTAAVEYQPRWSPDGKELLYLTRSAVRVAPRLGGSSTPVVLAGDSGALFTATWFPDGKQIAFVRHDSMFATAATGDDERLLGPAPETHACSVSPDARWIACAAGNGLSVRPGVQFGNIAPSRIVLYPAAGGAPIPITEALSLNESPVWLPHGSWLIFVSNRDGPRDLYVQAIRVDGHPDGPPQRVTTGLNAQSVSIAADGARFAYDVYTARSNIWSLPIPSHGPANSNDAKQLTTGNQLIEYMNPSPDGRWLLYDSNLHGSADIYRIPIGGGASQRLTSEAFDEFAPSLSPDGRLLAYHSFRTGTRDIEVKPVDGGPAELVTNSPANEAFPEWSPDGRRLLFSDQTAPYAAAVLTRLGTGKWSQPDTVAYDTQVFGARWSADGQEVAYFAHDSTAPGLRLVIVTLSSGATRTVARLAGGPGVYWAPDGRLYVKTHDARGRAYIWQVIEGKPLRLMVRFPDLDRTSSRPDFAADRTHFYFTLEDRESDVFVADVTRG